MKHISLSFIAVGLILLCGCSEENLKVIPDVDPNAIPLHFYASMESQQDSTATTKATLSGTSTDDTRKVLWEPSDSIYVTNGKFGSKFSNVTEENADVAEFTGKLGLGTEYYAAFPYGFVGGFISPSFQLTLPTVQNYKADGIASESFPMVARCIDNVFEFKNLCGILVLNLTGTQSIDSIRFSGKSDTIKTINVSGPASVDMTYTDIPSLIVDSTANDYVVLNCIDSEGKGVTLNTSKPTPFHIVLPAESYAYFTIVIYSSDGKHMTINSEKPLTIKRSKRTTASSITFLADKPKYEFVDLGLSVNWASFNVGAYKPEDTGDKYAWGEIETKDVYNWSTYKWSKGSESTITKYCLNSNHGYNGLVDNKKILDSEDDVAHVLWGGDWRMPTGDEVNELLENCTWTYETQNGVGGYLVTSKLANYSNSSIFLPLTQDNNAHYWSSNIGADYSYTLATADSHAASLYFNNRTSTEHWLELVPRSLGYNVRPVCNSESWLNDISVAIEKDTLSVYYGYIGAIYLATEVKKGGDKYNYTITWSSTDESVAKVATDGAINFKGIGTAVIYADCKGIKDSCIVEVKEQEYVDLGLSVLWASYNIGATSPEEYGDYYAWGEIETKGNYSQSNYKYDATEAGVVKYSKYNTKSNYGSIDNKTTLDLEDDVAHIRWSGNWRMPSVAEFEELINNCSWEYTSIKDVHGIKFTSNMSGFNGQYIFLPTASCNPSSAANPYTYGYYWSNQLDPDQPAVSYYLHNSESGPFIYSESRSVGRSVRPVRTKEGWSDDISISLNVESQSIKLGDSILLTATIKHGGDVINGDVKWSSSNESIAIVDKTGLVNGIQTGVAVITATCYGKTINCTITIEEPDHEYVDLGLSVNWATFNVGTYKPEGYGSYFSWGEVEAKEVFGLANYKWYSGSSSPSSRFSKYNDKVDTRLELDDDAAHILWGGEWRMPTYAEIQELVQNCHWAETTLNGVAGLLVTSNVPGYSGNNIFLPFAGFKKDNSSKDESSCGYYWSSISANEPLTDTNSNAHILYTKSPAGNVSDNRYNGLSIRPVCPSTSYATSISLDKNSITLVVGNQDSLIAITKNGDNEVHRIVSWSSNHPEIATVDEKGVITAIAAGTATITAECLSLTATCTITVKNPDPEFVNLGLSVNWATFNVGAVSPEDYGGYYAWGEIETKASYNDWPTYKWCKGSYNTLTKYCNWVNNISYGYSDYSDNKKQLDPSDDVAQVLWGGEWRMPTNEEFAELRNRNKCTWTWKTINGISGYEITSKVPGYIGNSIFLPAGGINFGSDPGHTTGSYWSSTRYSTPTQSYNLYFNNSGKIQEGLDYRYAGCTVRPVCLSNTVVPITSISINQSSLELEVGGKYPLEVTIKNGDYVLDYPIEWTSNDNDIASVDENGVVTAVYAGTVIITASCQDKSITCSITITSKDPIPQLVDLGLSVKWANFNLGGSKPEDAGVYYAWGELTSNIRSENYRFFSRSDGINTKLTKYITDGKYGISGSKDDKIYLELKDDISNVRLGGKWRMPTKDEFEELLYNCTWVWSSINGTYGFIITSNISGYTDKNIFLPAVGYTYDYYSYTNTVGCFYWSNQLNKNYSFDAWELCASENDKSIKSEGRSYENSIRPVCTSESWPGITSIQLDKNEITLSTNDQYVITTTIMSGSNEIGYHVSWESNNNSIATVDDQGKITAVAEGTATITATCKDKTATCTITVTEPAPVCEYVDLGLSVYWATVNVGALLPNDYGNYYAWGETSAKNNNTWVNYKFRTSGDSRNNVKFSKYNIDNNRGVVDNKTTLEIEDDVANQKWGGKWRIPTYSEFIELKNKCSWEWTTQGGVKGYIVTSKVSGYTDKSIFLPAAGIIDSEGLRNTNTEGEYWSSSLYNSYTYEAKGLGFTSDNVVTGTSGRCLGFSIRPVLPKHDYVDLGLSVKWATCNVGASSPEEYGDTYAWGEITTKQSYELSNYKWQHTYSDYTTTMTKYSSSDGLSNLEAEDDVASVIWGGNWHIPTKEEIEELYNSCTWTWTTVNGVEGYKVTSNIDGYTSNYIFLPMAGWSDRTASNSIYSSSTVNFDNNAIGAWAISFEKNKHLSVYYYSRFIGTYIRPVCP